MHILSEIVQPFLQRKRINRTSFAVVFYKLTVHKIIETKLNEEILWRKSAFIAMINGSADSAFDYNSEFIDFIA